MSRQRINAVLAVLSAGAAFAFALTAEAQDAGALARGEYVFRLSGCEGCHTDKKNDGARLAGGREFKTDFGVFYSPNITPDTETGLGAWSLADFTRALRKGVAPDGSHYYPAFPYPAYTAMTDQDIEDLWTYLGAQAPVRAHNKPHDLYPPFSWRGLMVVWNWLYLDPGSKPAWKRGRYVAEALSHCHECHTPRIWLGARNNALAYAGTTRNPEGIEIPNITSDKDTGIGKWSEADLRLLFMSGMLPDGDFVGGVMAESVTHATSKMTDADLAALIDHLKTLPPVVHQVKRKKSSKSGGEDWQ